MFASRSGSWTRSAIVILRSSGFFFPFLILRSSTFRPFPIVDRPSADVKPIDDRAGLFSRPSGRSEGVARRSTSSAVPGA
ncbi:hypothetical protein TR75_12705 [Hydrogenibacillus schlegelii]|uniref:Uncharacterized protein n=1 Tax=Hydrogenibacillus schlegelii TaxID=1484 RepID=A0A132MFU6_HYDSH|nr:hypothetical protein TR75_12705 [Hydrogenibacillus schlegelii]OAR05327.1 hypothetical protein SA87_08150 [Hydrogenibacillus schlegelii]